MAGGRGGEGEVRGHGRRSGRRGGGEGSWRGSGRRGGGEGSWRDVREERGVMAGVREERGGDGSCSYPLKVYTVLISASP